MLSAVLIRVSPDGRFSQEPAGVTCGASGASGASGAGPTLADTDRHAGAPHLRVFCLLPPPLRVSLPRSWLDRAAPGA